MANYRVGQKMYIFNTPYLWFRAYGVLKNVRFLAHLVLTLARWRHHKLLITSTLLSIKLFIDQSNHICYTLRQQNLYSVVAGFVLRVLLATTE